MKIITLILLLLIPCITFALTAEKRLTNDNQELRARALFKQIRCVVCAGESINDSKADIAKDMRSLVRNLIKSGKTDEQIKQYIVQRYGYSILMTPPVKPNTYLLWFGPIILLLIGSIAIIIFFRRNSHNN